jgi:hypothetical protein
MEAHKMIKIENVEIVGFEAAIRGMRNPMNSWEKSDSGWTRVSHEEAVDIYNDDSIEIIDECDRDEDGVSFYIIGKNDRDLMMQLRNAGTDHRKFMRMITVYVDITAPLYWWKEFDTYKVGTVANSCSTMHKIAAKEFTLEDFSCEHLLSYWGEEKVNPTIIYPCTPMQHINQTIACLNVCRKKYLETKDKKYWWQMIQLLPSSYNQKRTVMLNYEVLANIYKSRLNHKLDEWRELCAWIETLSYAELVTGPDLSRTPICDEIMEEAKERIKMETYAVTPRNKE